MSGKEKRRNFASFLFCCIFLRMKILTSLTLALGFLLTGCLQNSNKQTSATNTSNASLIANKPETTFSNKTDDSFKNQMTVEELRQKLDEVEDIERESRKKWLYYDEETGGTAECREIMTRLQPRARAIANEHKRMLSPAGFEIASAAQMLSVCVMCMRGDDGTDCQLAQERIKNAEKELKKEMRKK